MKRNRIISLTCILITLSLGLVSRSHWSFLPSIVSNYAGDTLWALMVFFGIGFLAPRLPTHTVALLALLFSFGIEVSQLYHAPWIDELRHTRLGGLILGFGFLWSDLACYTAGIGLGIVLEKFVTARSS